MIDLSTERGALVASAAACLVIGVVALIAAAFADAQVILLDGLFNLVFFAAGLFTLKVAALVQQPDDDDFPMGYGYFEPLVNGFKGMLIFGMCVLAGYGAIEALFEGGRAVEVGVAIAYGAFATLAGLTMTLLMRRSAAMQISPLVQADATNWLVNAAISAAVLLAFALVPVVQHSEAAWLAPYVDPILVLAVIALSIAVPIRMAWNALMEMLNRAPPLATREAVRDVVEKALQPLPIDRLHIRVIRPGRSLQILVHAIMAADYPAEDLDVFDARARQVRDFLRAAFPGAIVDTVFTKDPGIGAPMAPF